MAKPFTGVSWLEWDFVSHSSHKDTLECVFVLRGNFMEGKLYPWQRETDAFSKSGLPVVCSAVAVHLNKNKKHTGGNIKGSYLFSLGAHRRHHCIFSNCILSPNITFSHWSAVRSKTGSLSLCNCPRAQKVQWLWSLVSSQAILFYICLHYWARFTFSSSAHCSFIASFYVSGSRTKLNWQQDLDFY